MAISDDDPRAPYEQIADDLREQIVSGDLKPRQRLPSTRDLMERYNVANQTVQSAMRILRSEDLIHSVAGRGTYVRDDTTSGDGGAGTPSPQYEEIMARLDSIADGMTRLDERLAELEADRPTKTARKSAKPKAPSNRPGR